MSNISKSILFSVGLSMSIFSLSSCKDVVVESSDAYRSSDDAKKETTANGNTKTFDFTNFSSIEASGFNNIYLTQADEYKVEIKSDNIEMQDIKIEQSGDRLIIKEKSDWINTTNKKKGDIYISLPVLSSFELSGASNAQMLNTFQQSEKLNIDMSGAGKLNLNLNIKSLEIDASGASSINLNGTLDDLIIDMSGAGSIDALSLCTANADIQTSGAGSVSICVNNHLKVNASGVGSIRYKGKPSLVEKDISGMASIKNID